MSTYVYGITRATGTRLPEGLTGIGEPPLPVRVVRRGPAAALVSDCPAGLRPRRRDLFAHQRVLSAAAERGPVLPLRFGAVSQDDAAVRAALAEHAELYREQLDAVTGRSEYNVKAMHREERVLRRVIEEHPEIRTLNEATRTGGRAAYAERLRLGRLVADALRGHEERDAREVVEALAPHAERHVAGPGGAGRVANLSFLVEKDRAEAFLTAVEVLSAASPQMDVRVTGPLPAYSFVRTEPAQAA
ncbi:GvpL/GvpF family gas vesicle protein [Streptomyces sp. DSM 44917]|uniref:GvpL/GvpF family gas vesicle protein n=1 Tax=Streptomyces boetiae TaxID=3075541 RepID=A0ABU2L386_9ACTN|nr:GvpL/GvpF family gas vesicle protein [Streptomyces sp. DSM 44917]MDT0305827.1 GvpL/GvpF family gas vesicle protein [Streptomyces sp. DSM 44917]